MEALIRGVSLLMWPAMIIWLIAGLACLIKDVLAIGEDEKALDELKEITKQAQGSNYETKMAIRMDLVSWADKNAKKPIARWIFTVHNAVYAGGQGDAAALADAIWSAERERHYWFRYFAKNAILLGLFFTSVGLCETLSGVAPALTAKAATHNAWLQSVQAAMANALGGMSAAFYSSLAGLFISLVLSLLANVFLTGRHEAYLHKLDAYLQGSLVPVFTSIVEKDRNDLIREMLSRTEEAFDGIQKQFKSLVEQNQAQYKDLSEFRQSLARTVEALDGQLGMFGKGVNTLTSASTGLVAAAEGIASALDGGMERLSQAHSETLNLHNSFQEGVVRPFAEYVAAQSKANAESHKQVLSELSMVSSRFHELAGSVESQMDRSYQVWLEQQAQFERAQLDLANVASHFVKESERFHQSWYQMAGSQSEVLGSAVANQNAVLDKVSGLVASFSIAGEAVQRQLAEIYGLHQQEVAKLYESIGGRLGETLEAVAKESSQSLITTYSQGLEKALLDTHEQITGLDQDLRALVAHQTEGIEAMRSLHAAVTMNAEGLQQELTERRVALEALLAESVQGIQATLDRSIQGLQEQLMVQGNQVFDSLGERLAQELQDSLSRQEKIVSDLNKTVGRKWEHLLTAYEGAVTTSKVAKA